MSGGRACRAPVIAALVLSAIVGGARGAQAEVSPAPGAGAEPVVELYTMGVGQALFERFGHAALCLRWPSAPFRDRCFNYGTADFQTPGPLTWAFLRGRADFWVSTATPGEMLAYYEIVDRTVWRQVLPLSREETGAVVARLERDTGPATLHFTYHHFHDNCTTRVRDLVDGATGGRLRAGSGAPARGRGTFRDVVRRGFAEETWLLAVSDLLLGRAVDEAPTRWQMMFLPAAFRDEVRDRFGAAPVVVYERRGRRIAQDPGWGGRGWLALLAALLAAPVALAWRAGRRERAAIAPAAAALGLAGSVVWAVAIVSVLPELRWNEAALVLVPLDLALPALPERWRRGYARARVVGLALVAALLAVGVLRQPLWALIGVVALPLAFAAWPRRRRA